MYHDFIVDETDGAPRYTFRNRQGAVILEDVSAEIASRIVQKGDTFGALAANTLLTLEDGIPKLNLDGGTY